MIKKKLELLIIFIIFGIGGIAFAQQPTTTPAPTKTVTPITPVTTESTQVPLVITIEEPFVQEDLNVLVGNVQRPNGIVWLNGNLYTACNGDFTLYEVNAETGATTTFVYGVRNAYTLYGENVANGFSLWIPDFDTNQIVRVNESRNAPRTVASELLDAPWGISYYTENSFLVTNFRAGNIVEVTRDGEVSLWLEGLRSPAGIVVDEDAVYVANNGSARRAIEWVSIEDEVPTLRPLVSGLDSTTGIQLGADNYLYFAYSLGTRGVVGRVNPEECRENGCTNENVEIVVYTDLQSPLAGLSLSPDMRLFVHTIYRPEIYWVDLKN